MPLGVKILLKKITQKRGDLFCIFVFPRKNENMKKICLLLGVITFIACSKTTPKLTDPVVTIPISPQPAKPTVIVYPITTLDSLSNINKTTSWYNTNKAIDEIFDVFASMYWGFESTQNNGLVPYNTSTTSSWSSTKQYYWNDLGTYIYTDLTGDGKKDLWAYYWKNPWPTNATGLHLFSEYQLSPETYELKQGLTQVRKCVLSDFNNDKKNEVMLFSSGYDGVPFPGDSLGIYYVNEKRYQYLSKDIGYYHGGAAGDINNDGRVDIVAYSGGSQVIPTHPTAYINNGGGNFLLSKQLFTNFKQDGTDNYYTVELFDIDGDGWLDLFLGGREILRIIPNKNGVFDRANSTIVQNEANLELMDVAYLDFDKDGRMDVLTMSNSAGYNGYGIRLLLNKTTGFVDATKNYFNVYEETGAGAWIKWIHLFDFDKDGDIDIVADGLFGTLNGSKGRKIYWRNDEGKFNQVKQL